MMRRGSDGPPSRFEQEEVGLPFVLYRVSTLKTALSFKMFIDSGITAKLSKSRRFQ